MTTRQNNNTLIGKLFSTIPGILEVYRMPGQQIDNVLRLAVVVDKDINSSLLQQIVHDLEIRLDAIVDIFMFHNGTQPPNEYGDFFYQSNQSHMHQNGFYMPYNEDDFINISKIETIELFADKLENDPSIRERLFKLFQTGNNQVDRFGKRYFDDWYSYLSEYPLDLLIRFLRSRTNHLQEICADSPILRYRNTWFSW